MSMSQNKKDNIWNRFVEYKHLRDTQVRVTIDILEEIVKVDEPFDKLVVMNPEHENYNDYKEIVDALQIYHNSMIDVIKALIDELKLEVNILE